MNIIFGTDGWRGLIDEEINEINIEKVAQAFADYLNDNYENPSVGIAYDGRKFSKEYSGLFAEVLSGNNVKVILADRIIPTPFLSWGITCLKASAGVMLTASHNPAEYNGIKFKGNYGGPFFTEETHKVEKLLGKSEVKKSSKNISYLDYFTQYYEHIFRMVNMDIIKQAKLKILADSMGGAGQRIFEQLFNEFKIPADTIFGEATEDFSGRYAEPIEKNLSPLSETLKKGNYSLGLATDGDADRLGIMMENGEWLSAQETILYLADYLKNEKGYFGNLVKTSSVTGKLNSVIKDDQTKIIDVQVGFKYICETMISEDVAFGAEESGGFGFKYHVPERDGILSGLMFTEMLAKSGYKKLSEFVEAKRKKFGKIYYDRIDAKYSGENRESKLPTLFKNKPALISSLHVTDVKEFYSSRGLVNGLKFYLGEPTRWLLIRSSETEPLFRYYAEGNSAEEVKNLLSAGVELIEKI